MVFSPAVGWNVIRVPKDSVDSVPGAGRWPQVGVWSGPWCVSADKGYVGNPATPTWLRGHLCCLQDKMCYRGACLCSANTQTHTRMHPQNRCEKSNIQELEPEDLEQIFCTASTHSLDTLLLLYLIRFLLISLICLYILQPRCEGSPNC